jgi:hypothetical protein
MANCTTCHRWVSAGYRQNGDRFCSLPCLTYSDQEGFCDRCLSETRENHSGDLLVNVNLIGVGMLGRRDRCPSCHSIVQTKWIQVLLPLFPLKKYRVIYTAPDQVVGRELAQ